MLSPKFFMLLTANVEIAIMMHHLFGAPMESHTWKFITVPHFQKGAVIPLKIQSLYVQIVTESFTSASLFNECRTAMRKFPRQPGVN